MKSVDMRARDKAVELLRHYFKTAYEASGLKWGPNNDTEIETAIHLIVNAAVLEALGR